MKVFFLILMILISCSKQHEIKHYRPGELPVRWSPHFLRQNNGLSISISRDLIDLSNENEYDGHHIFEQMALRWDESVPWLDLFSFPFRIVNNVEYSVMRYFNDHEMGIYNSPSWTLIDDDNVLAVTTYFGIPTNGYLELTHVDIMINSRDNEFSFDPFDFDSYYLPCIILHELGHLLGLDHRQNFESVMYPSARIFDYRCDLSRSDISDIQEKYSEMIVNSGESSFGEHPVQNGVYLYHGVRKLTKEGNCTHELTPVREPASL